MFKSFSPTSGSIEPVYNALSNSCKTLFIAEIWFETSSVLNLNPSIGETLAELLNFSTASHLSIGSFSET